MSDAAWSRLFWFEVLFPVALLWLVGGIVIGHCAMGAARVREQMKDKMDLIRDLLDLWEQDQTTAELAMLRGELEAIEQVSIRKRCNMQFQRGGPPSGQPMPR
jgi:hypothetical protein